MLHFPRALLHFPRVLLLLAGLLALYRRRYDAHSRVISLRLAHPPITHPPSYLGATIEYHTGSSLLAACLILAGSLAAVILALSDTLRPQLKFIWHCFLRPLGSADQKTRLDKVCLSPSPRSPRRIP